MTPSPGAQFNFGEVGSFLKGKKIGNDKLLERLEIRDELPLNGY